MKKIPDDLLQRLQHQQYILTPQTGTVTYLYKIKWLIQVINILPMVSQI
jgi:hypothetical protein